MNLTKKTVSNPVLVVVVFLLITFMGLAVIKDIEINLMPDIKEPYLMISASYENAGPETVESAVTKIIEESLATISNLKKMTSTSSDGACEIGLEFNYGTDVDAAAIQVRDALEEIKDALPAGMKSPSIYKMNMNDSALMDIVILGNRSESELKYIADKKIKRMLLQANGVAQVSVYGGKTPAVRIDLSQNRLAAFGITVSEIAEKVALENKDFGAGKITENAKNFVLKTKGEYQSVEEIADTIVAVRNEYNVRLSDLGNVYMGFEDSVDEVYIDGKSGVSVSVKKQSGSNAVKVAKNVYEKIEEIQKILPSDIKLKIISDESESIRDALNTLYESAWQGILLAVLILFMFLRSGKSTFIIAVSIPISMIMTLLLMHIARITLNLMTLTGLILGIGMVVDASIVMIDNIYSYRLRGSKPKVAAVLGTQEMISSVTSGNLTTIVVFIPFLLFLNNLEWIGLMAKDLIYTIISAIVSSLFTAVFLVPVLAGIYMPLDNPNEKPAKNKFLAFVCKLFERMFSGTQRLYKILLDSALRHRAVTIVASVVILAGSFFLVPFIGIEGFPESEGQSVTLNITLPVGSSLDKTREIVKVFEKYALESVSVYKTIFSSLGTSESEEEIMAATNAGSVSILLPPASQQKETPNQIKENLKKHFAEFPGTEFIFAEDRMNSFAGADIDIRLSGSDLEEVRKTSEEIVALLKANKNLSNIKSDLKTGLPQIEIEIDRKRANSLGVSIENAATELNDCVSGAKATKYRQKGNEYNVIVSLQEKDRQSLIDLDKITVQGTGGPVSLGNFARLKKDFGAVSLKHENGERTVRITGNFSGQKNAFETESQIKKDISENCFIPSGIIIDFGGSGKMMKEKGTVFAKIIFLAICMVFGLMASMYGSLKKPFINMFTIPFMIIGVILIHFFTGQSLSVMSLLGLVMLVGIVVNNGIILVDYTGLLIARGKSVVDACLEAGISRLRPVLMTTLTTVLGMLPMCFSKTGSAALVQPIGMCVVGGLLSSTLVTLIIIPVVYSIMCRNEKGDLIASKIKEKVSEQDGKSRIEIIANQSVEEDIMEILETSIPAIEYTLEENVFGKGKSARKLGSTIWPEMNFRLTIYTTETRSTEIQKRIKEIKTKFAGEGISIFEIKTNNG